VTSPSLRRTVTGLRAIDLPQGYAAVEELMRNMVKAVRAQQLYMPNNPMHQAALDTLRANFAAVWQNPPELVIGVTETELRWSDVPVLIELQKSSDSLPWLFYKDGIRELRFTKGFEDAELTRFLEIVNRARKATVDDDDLITMLWEADLAGLHYTAVDLQADGGQPGDFSSGGGAEAGPDAGQVRAAVAQAASERKSRVVDMADFDATLHFLDEKEVSYLRQEIEYEYTQDLRTNIVAALLDVFEQQPIDGVREEILDHVETMLAFLLASGSFRGVAYVLAETGVAASRAGDLSPQIQSRISTLADRLSAPDALDQLLEALDDAPTLPPREELSLLFDQMRPAALGTIFSWLPRLRAEQLRSLIAELADRLASTNTGEIVKLVESSDIHVSNEAMRRAGGLKASAAVAPIGRVIADLDPKRRLIAVAALAEIASIGALQLMERSISDVDRDVRIAAARSLASRGHRPALTRLEPIIRGKEIRTADITEKTAFFESYGMICGDAGVPVLETMLNSKGLFGGREEPEMRAAAAAGLGRIGSTKARDALQRAAADKDVVVRNSVARALRGAPA
jgi:hypothetical protein